MDILIILPNLKFGGAEKLHVNLANYWCKCGHNVEFVLMKKEGEYLSQVYKEVSIYSLNSQRFVEFILPLSKHIKLKKPDVILSAMWPLTSCAIFSWLISGRIGKIFLSDHIHLSTSIKHEINFSKIFTKISIKVSYPFANGLISVSKGVRDDMCRIAGIDKKKYRVIYNPVAIGKQCANSKKDRINNWGGENYFNILNVAELKSQKDHKTLLKAFALLPSEINPKMTILGKGSLMKDLIKFSKKIKIDNRVVFYGYVSDTHKWYCTSDVFVLSSKWEGFGNVIVEALECGVPIVSTDCNSGPREILKNGKYGKLVKVGDYRGLSKAIYKTYKEETNKEFLIERSKDFSVDKIASKYLEYFNE